MNHELATLGHFSAVARGGPDWPWLNFSPFEMRADRDDGEGIVVVVPGFLDRLQVLRERCGFALAVTSYYRSPAYNNRVAGSGFSGPHTTGRAVDIAVRGAAAWRLLEVAFDMGFTGLGVRQKGPFERRYIHLDDPPGEPGRPRPTVWSY